MSHSSNPDTLLPQDCSDSVGSNGQVSHFNHHTGESRQTQTRPGATPSLQFASMNMTEKPLFKTPIPGGRWFRISTTMGNVFYHDSVSKESTWTAPIELKELIATFDIQQNFRMLENNPTSKLAGSKRKAEDSLSDELATKVTKVDGVNSDNEESDEEESDEGEEEWQRQAAAQLAAEAERARIQEEEDEKLAEQEEINSSITPSFAVPEKVNLSIEEGKALFKTLLREKDVNPLHPWDLSLPKFISDPRYVLLPSVVARREAFDEYCKERARELRNSTVKNLRSIDPKEDFDGLLKDEVKSTRTTWNDFRRKWKKDRRFYGWGRDDRERERRFRHHLRDLGELKREAAQKAKSGFLDLLKETPGIEKTSSWKNIKDKIYRDVRYEAVGSSSLREELFHDFVSGVATAGSSSSPPETAESTHPMTSGNRQERKLQAVKDRQKAIELERQKVEAGIERSKMHIGREEGERIFMSLLTDAIRDPQTTWDAAISQLNNDPRFTGSPLPYNQQTQLFYSHIDRLRSKHVNNLHALFENGATTLVTPFDKLPVAEVMSSAPVIRLGYNIHQVEDEYLRWQRERAVSSRAAFDEMLAENSFVEFWGRLGKLGQHAVGSGLEMDDNDIGENEDEKVDMKALAKSVDIHDIEKVLKNDKRYIRFDHVPDQRQQWLRNYIAQLAAPKLSVHVGT